MITSKKQIDALLSDDTLKADFRVMVSTPTFQRMVEIVDYLARPVQPDADCMTNALANAKAAGARQVLELMLTMHEVTVTEEPEVTYSPEHEPEPKG